MKIYKITNPYKDLYEPFSISKRKGKSFNKEKATRVRLKNLRNKKKRSKKKSKY